MKRFRFAERKLRLPPRAARLYRKGRAAIRNRVAALLHPQPPGISDKRFGARNRGTILLVTHDLEIGGAQHLLTLFAAWLISSTKYSVRFVAMRSGTRPEPFRRLAPVFDVASHAQRHDPEIVKRLLEDFAGPDVKAILVNSVVSGAFFDYWSRPTPAIAYIHELPKLLDQFPDALANIKARAAKILVGSHVVRDALERKYGVAADRCEVVHSFIEDIAPQTEARSSKKLDARRKLDLPPDDFVVMGCGVVHWRKSPDLFIEVAERVTAAAGKGCHFLWIGGGPDLEKCRAMVEARALESIVTFIGFRDDVHAVLRAADVFLLPSEEDPFPLAGLYAAAAAAPIVCFAEAGGMPEFVGEDRGAVVPFRDVAAMANAVLRYSDDPALRDRHGANAQEAALADYTIRRAGPLLLDSIRRAAGLRPNVSIIVPSFNYDRFLGERLKSIEEQTFKDSELILLDDASTDKSLPTLQRFAKGRPGTRVIANEKNSGSPFCQWLRGIGEASGDLVWIAEADDTCSPQFLERLLPRFDDRTVFIAYARSTPIAEDGRVLGDYDKIYLNRIAKARWSKSYVATDHCEINAALGVANSIPNASAVVFRRFEPEPDFATSLAEMRNCGDWLFYLRALRGGAIAYLAESLNFHRRHAATVTSAVEGSERYFDELAIVRAFVRRTWRLTPEALVRSERFLEEDLDRFKVADTKRRAALTNAITAPTPGARRPNLLVVAPDLSPGGGQMFCVRLANAWTRAGGRAVLLNAVRLADHPKMLAKIDRRVSVVYASRRDFSFARLLADWDIEIVHSSIWWADRLVHGNSRFIPTGVPWVVTMHGCYETLIAEPQTEPRFPDRFKDMLERVDQWVHTAEKNRQVFEKYGYPKRLEKLANGYEPEPVRDLRRADFEFADDSFVLCLASRAIAPKGWAEAVEAVSRLVAAGRKVELMLIGEGRVAEQMRREGTPSFVHLYGQVANLEDHIAVADAGLLPSRFVGESQPLFLIELMAQGKPAVATDIGEVREMLEMGEGHAGIVIPLEAGRVPIAALAGAIEQLMDVDLYGRMSAAAQKRFEERYSMQTMLAAYSSLYDELLRRPPPAGR